MECNDLFSKIARNSVLQVASQFNATDYWNDRQLIGQKMKENLVKNLKTAHTEVTGFMLLKIDLPNSFEAAIVLTEVVKEQEKTMTTKRQVSLITQETTNIVANSQAQIMTINANASSVATQRLNEGAGKVSKQNIEYTALALKEVQSKLRFSNPK